MSSTAKAAFKQRVHHWAHKLDVPITRLALRPMRHKWASCSSSGQLLFCTELLPLDAEVWDLVIVHELLHRHVPNHGRLWKALMRAHLGEWEAAAARLPQRTSQPPRTPARSGSTPN